MKSWHSVRNESTMNMLDAVLSLTFCGQQWESLLEREKKSESSTATIVTASYSHGGHETSLGISAANDQPTTSPGSSSAQ